MVEEKVEPTEKPGSHPVGTGEAVDPPDEEVEPEPPDSAPGPEFKVGI